MVRHRLAALIVLALLAPILPAGNTSMPCCAAEGKACACPNGPGWSRCDTTPTVAPPEPPVAVLPFVGGLPGFPVAARVTVSPTRAAAAGTLELPDPVPRV